MENGLQKMFPYKGNYEITEADDTSCLVIPASAFFSDAEGVLKLLNRLKRYDDNIYYYEHSNAFLEVFVFSTEEKLITFLSMYPEYLFENSIVHQIGLQSGDDLC